MARSMFRAKSAYLSACLILVTVIAYIPALSGGFIWDDDAYVTNNRAVQAADGLKSIWFEPRCLPQYYPPERR